MYVFRVMINDIVLFTIYLASYSGRINVVDIQQVCWVVLQTTFWNVNACTCMLIHYFKVPGGRCVSKTCGGLDSLVTPNSGLIIYFVCVCVCVWCVCVCVYSTIYYDHNNLLSTGTIKMMSTIIMYIAYGICIIMATWYPLLLSYFPHPHTPSWAPLLGLPPAMWRGDVFDITFIVTLLFSDPECWPQLRWS